jgi:hypothetical protein
MTFAVSESSTDQYQRGDGGTGVGVKVGSGVKVAVAVFVAGITLGWDVEVASVCSTGADVDAAGLAQADRNMINVNNRATSRFIIPFLWINKKRGGQPSAPTNTDYIFN